MIHSIYHRFFEVLQDSDDEDELARTYLQPSEAFFRPYSEFMTQGGKSWEEFAADFGGRWYRAPEDVRSLQDRMEEHDVEALAGRAVEEAVRVIGPDTAEVDVYLCVGLELSNAFMVVVDGEAAVGVGLEAYGRTFGTTHVAFEDLLHVIPHELCHAVRARQHHSPLRRFFEAEDPARAFDGVPVRELAVEEGLAVAVGLAAAPDIPLARALFYTPEDYRWCEKNVERLLEEFAVELDRPLAGERYERYFGFGIEGDDRPPRTGYYLGHRLVRSYLAKHPCVTLAEAVLMPADEFFT